MAEATEAPAKGRGGSTTVLAGAVGERVAALREQAAHDPERARAQAWSWIQTEEPSSRGR